MASQPDILSTSYDLNLTAVPSSQLTTASNIPRTLGLGRDIGGIVNAGAGHDKVYARGGNDIVLGGRGNNVVNGGTGDDLLDGGSGRNLLTGGTGRDTFVLLPQGVQVVRDFQNRTDRLGLTNGLSFEMLEIVQLGSDTVIQAGSDQLGILKNVQSNLITAADFVQVGSARAGNMLVPTLVG